MALQTKTFTYGSLAYQSQSNGYILELTLVEQSADPATNRSEVDYTLRLRSGGNNRFSSYGLGATVTLDGTVAATRDRYTADKVSLGYNSSVTLLSGTASIAHQDDGTKEMAVAFAIDMAAGSYVPGPIAVTGQTMALTPIPRASTLGAADADIGAVCAISVNRKNSAFTHTLGYRFGDLTGYIGADWQATDTPVKLTDTSISFPVPECFYSQIPESPSGVCTLTVTTYSGDTQIGQSQSADFTVRANQALCAPAVTGTVEDVNEVTLALTGDNKRLVKFHSTARCTICAQAKNGASITHKRIASTVVTEDTLDIPNVETADIPFSCQDSRGYSGSAGDGDLVLVPYIRLTNNAQCRRTDPTSGQAVLTCQGDWFSGSFGAADNGLALSYSIDGGEEVAVQAVTDGDRYTASIPLEGLSYQQAHTVTVTAADKLDRAVRVLTVGKGIPVFDWGENDFQFHVPVAVPRLLLDGHEVHNHSYRGVCADGDAAVMPGVYRLDETSVNVPFTQGLLLAFRAGTLEEDAPVWQVAVPSSGTGPMGRMLWDTGTVSQWISL